MASSLHLAEHNLVAGLAYCPRLVDELGVDPAAFTDEAARDVLLLVQAVYGEHGDDRPIGIWELEAASNSIPERPLDRHDKSDLANVLLGGEMLFRQAASNWHVVSQEWRRRRFLQGLGDLVRPDVSIDKAIPDLRQFCDQLEAEGTGRNRLAPMTLAKLVEEYPALRRPVIDGLIREGETGNIIHKAKGGKSWLSYGIAISVATGRQLWGRYDCNPGRVLLCDNELHSEVLASRIPAVAQAMGLSVDDLSERLDVLTLRGRLLGLDEIGKLIRRAAEPYRLVIVDALYRALPVGTAENSNDDLTRIYNSIDAVARETGAAFLLVHHASKGSQVGKATTDIGSGAGAQSRAADLHLTLQPHEEDGVVVVDAAVRSFAPIEKFCLAWSFPVWLPADDCDPNQLKQPLTKGDERQAAKDAEGAGKIVAALRESGDELTERAIRDAAGMGRERCQRLLSLMADDGRLTKRSVDINGKPCTTYQLADHLRGSFA